MITLYHGSYEIIFEIKDEGLFGGLFATTNADAALSHGDNLHLIELEDESVLTQDALITEYDYERVKAAIMSNTSGIEEVEFEEVYGFIVEDKSLFDADMPQDRILSIFRSDTLGEASWEAQRIRGVIAKKLGFRAVEMNDEHGRTYLVLPGASISFTS